MQIKIFFTLLLLLSSTMANSQAWQSNYSTIDAEMAEVRKMLSLVAVNMPASLDPFIDATKDLKDYLSMFTDHSSHLLDTETINETLSLISDNGDLDLYAYDIDGTTQIKNILGQSAMNLNQAKIVYDNMFQGLFGGIDVSLNIFSKASQAMAIKQLTSAQLKKLLTFGLGAVKKTYVNAFDQFAQIKGHIQQPAQYMNAVSTILESIRKRIDEYRPKNSDWMEDKVDALYQSDMVKCHPLGSTKGVCFYGYKKRFDDFLCEKCIEDNYGKLRSDFIHKLQGKMDYAKHKILDTVKTLAPFNTQTNRFVLRHDELVKEFGIESGHWSDMLALINEIDEEEDFQSGYDKMTKDVIIPQLTEIRNISNTEHGAFVALHMKRMLA